MSARGGSSATDHAPSHPHAPSRIGPATMASRSEGLARGAASFEVASVVPARPEAVWERVTTFEGVNDELMPIVRMTCPPGFRRIDPATVPLGRPWFRSWILLLGVLPFDYDHLRLIAIEPGRGFHEDSTMLSQRRWVHRRNVEPVAGGTRVTDRIEFEPRVPVIGPALLLPLALSRVSRGSRTVAIASVVVLAVWFGVLFQYWHRDIGVDLDRRDRLVAFLEHRAPPTGDIAVAHPHDYLELAQYAPPALAARLVRLSDPELALRYTGNRSTEDGLVVLSGFAPLRIVPYSRQHTSILLLRTVRGADPDWIVEALANDGAREEPVAEDSADGFTLVRVVPAATP